MRTDCFLMHRKLYPMLCGDLHGKEILKIGDIYMCVYVCVYTYTYG